MSEYNYERFDEYVASGREQQEFAAFSSIGHAGEPAPDFTAVRLRDAAQVRLHEVTRRKAVVLEFGSFT